MHLSVPVSVSVRMSVSVFGPLSVEVNFGVGSCDGVGHRIRGVAHHACVIYAQLGCLIQSGESKEVGTSLSMLGIL